MLTLRRIQLQGNGKALEDLGRRIAGTPLFQTGVVLRADTGDAGHLVTPKTRHPAYATVSRQAGPLRRDPGPP